MSFPGQQQQQYNQQTNMQAPPYNDSILTITEKSCADPYVLWDKGTYYMVGQFTRINTLAIADIRRHGLLVALSRSGQQTACLILRRGARRTSSGK